MENLLNLVQLKWTAFVSGVGLSFAIGLAIKFVPKLIAKKVDQLLHDAIEAKGVNDPFVAERLKNIAKESVLLAEYLVPDDGLGPQKKAALKLLFDRLGLVGKVLYELVDPVVESVDKELKEAAELGKKPQ